MTPFASVPRRTIEFETATTGSWGNWGAAWGCNPQSREVVLEELRQRERVGRGHRSEWYGAKVCTEPPLPTTADPSCAPQPP